MRRQYPFQLFEPKWQEFWHNGEIFRAWNPEDSVPTGHPFRERHQGAQPDSMPKYYILDMFPYPSGAGLHVALRIAENRDQANILIMFSDGGWKYLPASPWEAALQGKESLDDIHWW